MSDTLQRILNELLIEKLAIMQELRQRFINLVIRHRDGFAGFPLDIGRTSVVVHTVSTGAA